MEIANFYSPMSRKALLSLILVLSVSFAWGQQRYIYLHHNATDENSSPDFNFTVTGPGGFNQTYTLNDRHVDNNVRDLGATNNGRLWAIMGSGADAPIYYRNAGSSSWQLLPGGASGINIDGGPANANIHSNSSGLAYYYDGATFYNTGAIRAGDVAMDKTTNRVFHVRATGSDAGDVYQKIVSMGTWNLMNNVKASRIDVAPNGDLVSASLSPTNGNVYLTNFNGDNVRNLGDPGNTGTAATDVAVGEDGVIYAIKAIFDGVFVYRYNGGYAAGGTWTQEPSSRQGQNITGGSNGQMWTSGGYPTGTAYRNIYTRTPDGFWIDDEPIKTTASNVVMIPVPSDGAYTITENAVSGWALGAIDIYDPNNNTTSIDIPNGTVTANVESGEVVHVVYKNQLIQTFTVGNDCASTAYLETFGTGNEPTVGAALIGQTNYHYLGIQGETIRDGYYTVASNSVQPGFGPKGGNFKDHTAGDGTGRMMLVNASYDKGIFFTRRFNGLLPGVAYSFSAWVMNISNTTIKPNVLFQVVNPVTRQVLASYNTGDITSFGKWAEAQLLFTATLGEVDLILSNNNIGGEGNDLALDDIRFSLATPTTPVTALGNCNGSTKTLQITSPLGSQFEYSIDGVNYQANPAFQVGTGTYPITARYIGSIGGCVTLPVTQVVSLDDCLTPFNCSNLAYQVSGPNTGNSNLYSYNVATGARTLMGALPARINSIGYNTLDNYIWGMNVLTNQVVKVGSNAALETYTVPNLPAPTVSEYYNVGEVFGDGYLFIYSRLGARYFVVDINPARTATYLQLVDPTASYVLDAAPYGNTFTGAASLDISDIVYNSSNGLLYGIIDAQSTTNAYRRFTINPVTRQVTIAAATVAGGGIQNNEKIAFGSTFIDQTANTFYVFANTLGGYYKIDMTTNAATLVSVAPTGGASNNDGASCPDAFLTASITGNVFHDPNAGNVNNSTGSSNTVPSGLFANLVGTDGNVAAVAPVNVSGIYGFTSIAAGNYTVVLSTTNGTVGSEAPAASLPAGWANSGEFNGAENTGNTAPVDGISPEFTVGVNSTDVNFGIQQPPVADVKSFTLPATPAANSTIQLGLGGDVNSGNTPANLTGNDPDGGVLNSTTAPYGVTINTLPVNGTLIYDGAPVTTPGMLITNYDPTKLEFQFTGSGYSDVAFSYSVHDAVGSVSAPASYAIGWTGPVTGTLVSGSVFHDPDADNVNHSSVGANTVPSGLFANLVGADGNVVAVNAVNPDGTYQLTGVSPGDYTIVLSTTSGSIGAKAPEPNLPAGWINTGEFNGAENTGNEAPVDGISPVFTVGVNSNSVNFGIQQPPVADVKSYTVPNAAFSSVPPASYPAVPAYLAIQASSANLTGYPSGGSLSGSDPEDCPAGECNTGSGTTFNIDAISPTTQLYYDFGTGPLPIDVTSGPVSIASFEVAKLMIYGVVGSGTGANLIGFTYSITDQAGATSAAASYTIQTEAPMPVTLISFQAQLEGQTVNLAWATSTEQNSMGFEIQRSTNASAWSKVGFVASKSLETGSTSKLDYVFADKVPLEGTSYYRLKMFDFDQSFAYSQIRSVSSEAGAGVILYPNPVSTSLFIKNLPAEKVSRIVVLNLDGRMVIDQRGMPARGIDVSRLPAGAYIVDIKMQDGSHSKTKMVVGR
ncbi:Por secretion system C-terminal sorting domain-containing protein [Dyadobacter sp. SG02]|uniref:T9SS type A sorting domain-containing protein n=1 Tax=Dyadobacter sp. SG02 TaxID=1855291 RepID=UPI0008C2B959|nr:T9SS type A sorting domain-containing protein [Dyadobacter sp. SG02]SEJ74321.1 Por secretion system C-terminal sorting domain-containing protein [Dyadobacter sp. SG02]